MDRNNRTRAEVKRVYTSKETQCNLIGNTLVDCNTMQPLPYKSDEYNIDITGDVNDLYVGPQFHPKENEQFFPEYLSQIPFNISLHGTTYLLDPGVSRQIISANPKIMKNVEIGTESNFEPRSQIEYIINGFVPTFRCSQIVGKNKDGVMRSQLEPGKVIYGPVCIGRQLIINET